MEYEKHEHVEGLCVGLLLDEERWAVGCVCVCCTHELRWQVALAVIEAYD